MKRVYFIKPVGMAGPIKIGCSVSPDGRRETLGLWCPLPLELLATFEGGFAVERQFHAMFWRDYIRHEWFQPSALLTDTIAAINAGTFDSASLPDPLVIRKPRSDRKVPRNPESAALIDGLGGVARVARLLNVGPTTVAGWKHAGIPASRREHIRIALERHNDTPTQDRAA